LAKENGSAHAQLNGAGSDAAPFLRLLHLETLDDLGSATFRADLASMRHETQYTRLFRS